MKREKYDKELNLVKCKCGYCNQPFNVEKYGTCTGCGAVLDEKVKFKYDMNKKLRLWRDRKW